MNKTAGCRFPSRGVPPSGRFYFPGTWEAWKRPTRLAGLLGGLAAISATPALLLAALAGPAAAETLAGAARVADGDTLRVGGVTVRLQGLAAPEVAHPGLHVAEEPGGPEARDAMRALVAGHTVVCELTAERTHGRRVGRCAVDGRDLGEAMIAGGLARRCPRFDPDGRYAALPENTALVLPAYCIRDDAP